MKTLLKYSSIYFTIIYLCLVIFPFVFGDNPKEREYEEAMNFIPGGYSDFIPGDYSSEYRLYDTAKQTVIKIDKQDFLIGSLISEMSSTVPLEALKAQTVAAFSYYSCLQAKNVDKEYDFTYNSENANIYTDPKEIEKSDLEIYQNAVKSVFGEILTYGSGIAYCSFFSHSNGQTESAIEVWGQDLPYLVSVASPYDAIVSNTSQSYNFAPNEVLEKVSRTWEEAKLNKNIEYKDWFTDIRKTIGGAVKSVEICGFTITGEECRRCFGLSSPCFTVEYNGQNFVFECYGEGNLVGMSQTGAVYMASEGADYKEILNWYYPKTVLKEIGE